MFIVYFYTVYHLITKYDCIKIHKISEKAENIKKSNYNEKLCVVKYVSKKYIKNISGVVHKLRNIKMIG